MNSTDHISLDNVDPPEWFLHKCVKLSDDLHDIILPVDLDNDGVLESSVSLEGRYLVDSFILAQFDTLLTCNARHDSTESMPRCTSSPFCHDAVSIRFPSSYSDHGGSHFLGALVEWFAVKVNAIVILLEPSDIIDLARSFGIIHNQVWSESDISSLFTPQDRRCGSSQVTWSWLRMTARQKLEYTSSVACNDMLPIIVHLVKARKYFESDLDWLISNLNRDDSNLDGARLVINTTERSWEDCCGDDTGMDVEIANIRSLIRRTGQNPRVPLMFAGPLKTSFQDSMFRAKVDKTRAMRTWKDNIERFEIMLDKKLSHGESTGKENLIRVLRAYGQWRYMSSIQDTHPFRQSSVPLNVLRNIVDELLQLPFASLTFAAMASIITNGVKLTRALDRWNETIYRAPKEDGEKDIDGKDPDNGEMATGKWKDFAPQIRQTLSDVEHKDKYGWESTFLGNIIIPSEVEDTWASIAITDASRDAIVKAIESSQDTARAYGLLKGQGLGGALIYGPSGTGKTHMIRVLAKESSSIVICVTSAELNHKYVGQSEKAIKGLFSLARLVHPAIIFIDEADAIL